MNVLQGQPLSKLTTMHLGGPAAYLIDAKTPEEISEAYRFATEKRLRVFPLGFGSNSLGHDEGFSGLILRNRIRGIKILEEQPEDDTVLIYAGGGEAWDSLVEFTCKHNLSGLELMSAIPSSVAAAPVQNIGAYGSELSDVLISVDVYDTAERIFKTLPVSELGFSYRRSIFNHGEQVGRYFIIAITIKTSKTPLFKPPFYTSLQAYLESHQITEYTPKILRTAVCSIRSGKLPDPKKIGSAGSFFKNIYLSDAEADQAEAAGIPVWRSTTPDGTSENKINSGWLIEHASLKGKLLHGIRVNDQAALVLMNESATSFADLAAARDEIRAAVQEKFGFYLEQEPIEIV